MTLRERLNTWLGSNQRAATGPISFHTPSAADFGPGLGNQPSHENLLRNSLGIADTATRAIANRISTLNPLVKVKRRLRDGTEIEEILDDHVLKALLDRPHPNFTRAQILRLLAQWIVTVGEGYWLKVGNGFGLPMELHPAPPAQMTPLIYQGVVESYIARDGNGKPTTLPADTVCRFFFPDPENPWASEGYLGPEGITADSLKFAGQHLRRHYEHDATPKSTLESGENATAFGDVETKRWNLEWVKKYHRRAGLEPSAPAILPLGYKLVQMAIQSGADIVPLLEFWRDEQLMGMGTPRSILGQVVSGDRSSAETNQYVFDRHAVLPIANLIADGITLQIAHEFDPKIFVEFEEFVSADKEFGLKQEVADLNGKVRSVNQVREDRGLDDVDWGELPVATIGQQPYDPDAFLEMPADVPGALGDDEEPEEPRGRSDGNARPDPAGFDSKDEFMAICVPQVMAEGKTNEQAVGQCSGIWENRARQWFAPQNEWERQIQREKKYVPAFLRAMRSIFKDQLRSVLLKLKEEEPRTRAVNPELLFIPEDWERLFTIRAEPVRITAYQAILQETLSGLGVGDAFMFTDAMQKTLREQGAQLVQHANKTTKKRIAAQLVEANAEGEGVDQIAKRIEGVFKVRRTEARTIARTEVLKASQTAQLEGFEMSGVVERKQWNTNRDPEVRDSHAYAEGQIRDLREPFDLAGEPADAPGIGAGGGHLSAENSINCRCFVTPVVEG